MQTKRLPYTFNRDGYYYFSRRVPNDVVEHYKYPRVVQSLHTKQHSIARTRALMLSAKLDEHWSHMRLAHADLPGKQLLKSKNLSFPPSRTSSQFAESMSLTEAVETYLTLKGASKTKTFHSATHRSCGYLVDACGLKHLHDYNRSDALAFRDSLIARGLAGSSITRVFNSVIAVFNFVISEHALDLKNPFTRVYHNRSAGVSERQPISIKDIKVVQKQCREFNDEARWLIARVTDTGLRLAEAAGVLVSDLKVHEPVPNIVVAPNTYRGLKTSGSKRVVPLVGASLWAAQRIVETSTDLKGPAFPRYNKKGQTNANSASGALNKWLRPYVEEGCSMHGFRHSMRDRLRAVNCPTEIVDQIGGWSPDSIGQGYGRGYQLEQLQQFMSEVVLT